MVRAFVPDEATIVARLYFCYAAAALSLAGGPTTKTIGVVALAILVVTAPAWAQSPSPASAPSIAADANGLPPKWDKRIPLPKGAVLTSVTAPKAGIVYAADFSVVGNYNDLVNFYETGLAKAGFKLGPKAAIPARKVYNRTFTWTDILDSVVISPDPKDPAKFIIHFAYTPPRED